MWSVSLGVRESGNDVPSLSEPSGNLTCSWLFERGSHFVISSLSELSWSFLSTLMAHYSDLSLISVVLEDCKSHFPVGFHCLGLLLKSQPGLACGGPFGSSLLIWLSWKSTLAKRGWARGVTKTFPV